MTEGVSPEAQVVLDAVAKAVSDIGTWTIAPAADGRLQRAGQEIVYAALVGEGFSEEEAYRISTQVQTSFDNKERVMNIMVPSTASEIIIDIVKRPINDDE